MSSRSKERITSAIRKIFRTSKDKAEESKDDKKNGDANVGAGNGAVVPVAGKAAIAKNGNATDSPGKRLRKPDNKVSPANKIFKTGNEANIRARRLMKEFREMKRMQESAKNPIFTVELVNDNLFEWHARIYVIDPDSKLAQDLVELNIPCILLHLVFPDNFPFSPPFMRVVEPRIEKGYVMEGGAICMELLTPRGWASAYTIEAILMQFAASVVKGHGRVLRKTKSTKEFNQRTAEEAFRSLVKTHEKYGWVTPALADG